MSENHTEARNWREGALAAAVPGSAGRTENSLSPSAPAVCSSLSDQVRDLERRAADWEKLAREVMATIRVNRLRGTITSADEKHFDQICEGWYRWMMRIVTGREEPLQYGGIYFCQICGEAHKNGEACPHSSKTNVL